MTAKFGKKDKQKRLRCHSKNLQKPTNGHADTLIEVLFECWAILLVSFLVFLLVQIDLQLNILNMCIAPEVYSSVPLY